MLRFWRKKKAMEEEKDIAKETEETPATGAQPETAQTPANPPEQETQEKAEKPGAEETPDKPETPKNPEKPEKPAGPDWKDMYARLLADFDNFKKRTARDREDSYRFAEADILGDVLPSVDNLALALEKAEDKENAFVKGVSLVYDSLLKALKDHGAEPFDSIGKELDTAKMEAIATLPSEEFDEGKVSNEVKKGWMLKDKVLRAAQVVVSSGKASNG